MKSNIKIKKSYNDVVYGYVDDYYFICKVTNERCIAPKFVTIKNEIYPNQEYKTGVYDLKIYKIGDKYEGDPFKPSLNRTATTYANFTDGKWSVCSDMIKDKAYDLIGYLNRRNKIKCV